MGETFLPALLAAAALLVVAGVPKVLDPKPLVRALRTTGLALGSGAVRAFAVAETVVGLLTLLWPSRVLAAAVAVLYLVFSAFVARALTRGGVLESCGCFGKADTPPTRAHLGVTLGAAFVGVLCALDPAPRGWLTAGSTSVLTNAALAALVGVLAWAVMSVLPTATAQAARSTASAEPGGGRRPAAAARRGATFTINRPAPLPDPTFPPPAGTAPSSDVLAPAGQLASQTERD